jgi:hypothetical protein
MILTLVNSGKILRRFMKTRIEAIVQKIKPTGQQIRLVDKYAPYF